MALPIAQLGYIPNINTPGYIPANPTKPNPWEQLAIQALSGVIGGAVQNGMSRDYASQATASNPEQVSVGPMTDASTGETFGGASKLGPQDAPLWSKILQGPQMSAQQYDAELGRRNVTKNDLAQQKSAKELSAAAQSGETARTGMQVDATKRGQDLTRQSQADEVNQRYDAMMQQAGNERDNRDAARQGSIPANKSADADMIRAQNSPTGPQSAAESASVQVFKAYIDYVNDYAKQSVVNQALKKPSPPMMTQEQFFQQYNAGRPTFGLQQFQGQQGQGQ